MLEHINNAGMRACSKDNYPLPFDVSRQETLVHNQWIIFPGLTVLAQPFVTRKALLITGDAWNLATDKEHIVEQHLWFSRHNWGGSLGCVIFRRGYLFDRQQSAARQWQRPLTKHARMQVA